MKIVVRNYTGKGAAELFDLLEQNKTELLGLLKTIPSLVSYTLARTDEGGVSVTICREAAGIEESVKIAREWIRKNASAIGAGAPQITQGTVN